MKKFEEELKNGPVMIDKDSVTGTSIYDEGTLISYFKGWVSPETLQLKENEVKRLYNENKHLKSQLEKQKFETNLALDDLQCANEEIERVNARLNIQQPEISEFVEIEE